MGSYNRIIIMGHLTRDPQLTYLPSQTPVVEFGLATNRKWKSNDGAEKEDVCFIDCRAYGKVAETINKYVKKGQALLVEGRLTFDQWEPKDGGKRSKHRVTVESFTFVEPATAADSARVNGGQAPQDNYKPPESNEFDDSDCPF